MLGCVHEDWSQQAHATYYVSTNIVTLHSTPKTTLDVYSHCLEKGEEEVLSVLNGLPVKKK